MSQRGTCHVCGSTTRELRPYGAGGAPICFPCMTESPEREAEAGRQFGGRLGIAAAADPHGVVAIGSDMPPVPASGLLGLNGDDDDA